MYLSPGSTPYIIGSPSVVTFILVRLVLRLYIGDDATANSQWCCEDYGTCYIQVCLPGCSVFLSNFIHIHTLKCSVNCVYFTNERQ